jgi:hypothetical protein
LILLNQSHSRQQRRCALSFQQAGRLTRQRSGMLWRLRINTSMDFHVVN